jgi:3-methyladenine DNA glycosylase AlkD
MAKSRNASMKPAAASKPAARAKPSKTTRATPARSGSASAPAIAAVTARLRALADRATLEGMSRYGIPSDGAFGVPVGKIRAYAKELGRHHALALALWKTGQYESRMLACFVADPAAVTPAEMDAWTKTFDNWAVCDTACFHLFDRTPHAFAKVEQWARSGDEFVKRAAFALLASVALHDKKAPDALFIEALPLIERAASDDRNFVKKGVSWALRGIGKRRGESLRSAAVALAERLAASDDPATRWVGRDALKDLARGKSRANSEGARSPKSPSKSPSKSPVKDLAEAPAKSRAGTRSAARSTARSGARPAARANAKGASRSKS